MSLVGVVYISVALALDAFGVALSQGLDRGINKKRAILFIISFGFFQFLFAFIGGYCGCLFNRYIFILPTFGGGIIILIAGIFMSLQGFTEDKVIKKSHWYLVIILGISVSIDALVVGFSVFNMLFSKSTLLINSIIVGIITSLFTCVAFAISRHIRKIDFVKEYADFLGGIILILFGIKMIFF